jgi:multiple sugar transport system ATP-binding protein
VALGRAIAREPKVFLLDEPLSNLDAQLRDDTRAELKQLHQRVGITTIYVTHDQVEAMTLADQIVVLNRGRIQQIGDPQDIYAKPRNRMVATFLGNPPMNVFWQLTQVRFFR